MSPIRLGEGFRPPERASSPPESEPPRAEEMLWRQILVSLDSLREALGGLPRPEVHVAAPDLAGIVTAVNGLKPGAGADEIAEAIARTLRFPEPPSVGTELGAVAKALEKLDFRLQAAGTQAYGGGSVTLLSGQTIGVNNFPTARFSKVTPYSTALSASGSSTLITPGAGLGLRLLWLYAQSDPSNVGTTEVTFRLGGTDIYYFELDTGQPFSHSTLQEGAVGSTLTVFTSNANRIYYDVDYQQI